MTSPENGHSQVRIPDLTGVCVPCLLDSGVGHMYCEACAGKGSAGKHVVKRVYAEALCVDTNVG